MLYLGLWTGFPAVDSKKTIVCFIALGFQLGLRYSSENILTDLLKTQTKYNFYTIYYSVFRESLKHQVPLWYKCQMVLQWFW